MLRKMLFIMILITGSGITLLFLIMMLNIESTSGQPQEERILDTSFENEEYIYYLNKEEIQTAIEKGVTTLYSIDDYLLPLYDKESEIINDVVLVYIETPYLQVMKKARYTFDLYKRDILATEVHHELTDEYISFVIRFEKNQGYVYDTFFKQGEVLIGPVREDVLGNGGQKRVYFKVDELSLKEEGLLYIVDPIEADKFISYKVNFKHFIQPNMSHKK